MKNKKYSIDLNGKELTFEFLNWVERAAGSVLVKYGDTVVMTTVTMGDKEKEGMDYFPLNVEYREKYYAAGFIGGGRFRKREGRPADDAVLKGRLTDRTIRPLFNQDMRREVQVVNSILSYDPESTPDILALLGSSVALSVSPVPWDGPIAGIKVGREEGVFMLNPSLEQQEKNDINLTISGPSGLINMIEIDSKEVQEKDVLEAVKFATPYLKKLIDLQDKIKKEIGVEKEKIEIKDLEESIKKEIDDMATKSLNEAIYLKNSKEGGEELDSAINSELEKIKEKYGEENPEIIPLAQRYLDKLTDKLIHEAAIKDERRVDGRGLDEIRDLSGAVAVLPRTHGTGLFMRGLTHGLSITTLDAPGNEELRDEMEGEEKKRFMLHYNFPPYSVGEPGWFRGTGRREIGHGALAEKSIEPMIPGKEDFPYVIRIVTEILSSNGSTSMASVCSASLSLMDAGVPIKRHVAGIAMGLISSASGEAKILTDIQGPEDHYGDMDLKVAGTRNGITASQLDTKIRGLSLEVFEKALEKAKIARNQILDVLEESITEHRKELSQYAPIIDFIKINPEKIGFLIGPGGKMIKEIMAETNTEIEIENDGSVFFSGKKKEDVERAKFLAESVTHEVKIGEEFDSKVVKIADFGAFVELIPGQEALVHISELANGFVKNVEDVVKMGDKIHVKIIKIDDSGKISASAKRVNNKET